MRTRPAFMVPKIVFDADELVVVPGSRKEFSKFARREQESLLALADCLSKNTAIVGEVSAVVPTTNEKIILDLARKEAPDLSSLAEITTAGISDADRETMELIVKNCEIGRFELILPDRFFPRGYAKVDVDG